MTELRSPPFPPDVLLQHRDWVRALARSLVRDTGSADDLEQETWLRALRSMPRDVRSPRAWLATVMRNRLRDSVRRDARRGEREGVVAQAAARGNAGVGVGARADVIAEQAEAHRSVLQAVLDLEPGFRDVVLLRFFEGLSPAEIAERLGVPHGTVRTRLHRANDKLRAQLDAHHGGDQKAWRRALAPLLFDVDPTVNGRTRKTRTWRITIAAGLVLVAGMVPIAWQLGAHAPRDAGASSDPSANETADVADRGATPAGRRDRARIGAAFTSLVGTGGAATDEGSGSRAAQVTAAVLGADSEQETNGWSVTVVRGDGTAAADATVELRDGNSFAKSGYARVLATRTTDTDGRAVFQVPRQQEVRLSASLGDLAAIGPVIEVADREPDDTRLVLHAATALRGTLISTDGSPIAGARIEMTLTGDVYGPGGVARTDAAGEFAFRALPHAAFTTPANLSITAQGFPHTDHQTPRTALLGDGLRIELAPAVAFRGRCVDEEGRSIADVMISSDSASDSVDSDADGRFVLSGIDAHTNEDGSISISFNPGSHADRRLIIAPGSVAFETLRSSAPQVGDLDDVVFSRGHELRVRVLDQFGAPCARAHVMAFGDATRSIVAQGSTDKEGWIALAHLGNDTFAIEASAHSDDSFGGAQGILRGVGPAVGEVVLTVTQARSVLLEFVNEDGEPVALTNMLAFMEPLDRDETDDEPGGAFSSANGLRSVRLRAKHAGAYRLTVRSFEGHAEVVIDRVVIREDAGVTVKAVMRAQD